MISNQYTQDQLLEVKVTLKQTKRNYIKSLWFPFGWYKKKMMTDAGLCYALYPMKDPILRKLFFDDAYNIARKHKDFSPFTLFWFKPGRLRPRLKIINQLILYYDSIYYQRFTG